MVIKKTYLGKLNINILKKVFKQYTCIGTPFVIENRCYK